MAMSEPIVVLTGAGVSAESGIRTFRASDGLWEDHRVEDVATPEGFASDPLLVHRFYNERRRQLRDPSVRPNPAHEALARLEREYDGDVLVVTQNIDDLHERAGSRNVVHMHGELLKARCAGCGAVVAAVGDLGPTDSCEACGALGAMRPHVVWFGEIPLLMDEIYSAIQRCGTFVAIGTSGLVYPAAGFVQVAGLAGAHTVEINLTTSYVTSVFDEVVTGPAGEQVPAWVERLLART